MENTTVESKTSLFESKQDKLNELRNQQEKLKALQSELAALESKIKNNEGPAKEDLKFVAELGWLSAAAVTIALIADSM